MRVERNEIENRKIVEKNQQNQSWFFKINKIYKPLGELRKK